jgi:hypothetical protein
LDPSGATGKNEVIVARYIVYALLASLVASVPIAFGMLTIASGDVSEIVFHPGFWAFYVEGFLWLFCASFLASALTAVFVSKTRKPK